MALTPSNMLPLGTAAPDFTLPNPLTATKQSLNELASKDNATVIMFICNHCPYVVHIIDELVAFAERYGAKGIKFIAISSNDIVNYPADSPENMAKLAQEKGFSFPYLYDESQDVAKAYKAACTPDFYVFDKNLLCIYRGQFDDARPGSTTKITGKDLAGALDALLAGNPIDDNQKPSMGCNIKWKTN